MIEMSNLSRLHEPFRYEIVKIIENTIASSQFIFGEYIDNFEKHFQNYFNYKHFLTVANGTDALTLCLMDIGVGPGDEVIIPTHTWFSNLEVVINIGAKPVYVDVDVNGLIDSRKLLNAITKKTKAIQMVHLYGNLADVNYIYKIANEFNIPVIEDCAQAIGSLYEKSYVASGAKYATFSFFPGKNLGAFGDGGGIVTNNIDIYFNLKKLSNHGQLVKHQHLCSGMNSRLDNIQAAILDLKLPYINDWNKRRREIANIYISEFKNIEKLTLPTNLENVIPVYHQFVIKSKERNKLKRHLFLNDVNSSIIYPNSLPFISINGNAVADTSVFPSAKMHQDEILSLPIFECMNDFEIEKVINAVKNYFK